MLLPDLEVNSLLFIKIIVGIEKEFDIEVEDEFMSNNSNITFGDLTKYLKSIL